MTDAQVIGGALIILSALVSLIWMILKSMSPRVELPLLESLDSDKEYLNTLNTTKYYGKETTDHDNDEDRKKVG